MRLITVSGAAAILLVASAVSTASARTSDVLFTIRAQNGTGQGAWSLRVSDSGWTYDPREETYTWVRTTPLQLRSSGGEVVATLSSASFTLVEDPSITLNFAVQAGSTDTDFTIDSALLSFSAISPAEGRASAALTATDGNGNGATLTGLHAGPGGPRAYLAAYNGFTTAGTAFAYLVDDVVADSFGSFSESEQLPLTGRSAIPGSVSDISTQLRFRLTAGDSASGTTNFEVIPEPASLLLLALGGLGLLRRR